MKASYYPGCTLKTKAKNLEDAAIASLATFGIELEELLRINNLPVGAWIFPGDKLLIKAPGSEPVSDSVN